MFDNIIICAQKFIIFFGGYPPKNISLKNRKIIDIVCSVSQMMLGSCHSSQFKMADTAISHFLLQILQKIR